MAKSLEKTVVRVFGAGAGLVFSAVLWINSNFFCNSCLTSVRRRRPTRLTQTLGFLLSSFPPTFAFFRALPTSVPLSELSKLTLWLRLARQLNNRATNWV